MSNTLIACDPAKNVVVEACAGSGKTWLLTSRMFRILLAGAKPSEILAITFTRKAAIEMRQRLSELLAQCLMGSEAQLDQLLRERGVQPDEHTRSRARALAGEVLTDSKGVTIDTFHGWFASLCQMAPLGCGFSRQAEPTEQTQYLRQVACDALIHRISHPEGELRHLLPHLNVLAHGLNREGVNKLLMTALNNWVSARLWLNNADKPTLAEVFDINLSETWPQQVLQDSTFVQHMLTFASWLGRGTDKQGENGARLEAIITDRRQGEINDQACYDGLWDFFMTKEGEGRKTFKFTKNQQASLGMTEADYFAHIQAIFEQFKYAHAKSIDVRDYQRSQAFAQLLPELLVSYKNLKVELALCDFDDLENTALGLLMDDDQSAYMQQKLDQRVGHLLIDEFQDTNPVQWSVLRHWLSGYGSDYRPSVFLVGDPKQSIYRFRRAESRLFQFTKEWLQSNFDAEVVESDDTRRCSLEVIDIVNKVFAPGETLGDTPFRSHGSSNPDVKPLGHEGMLFYPLVDYLQKGAEPESLVSEAEQVVNALLHMKATGQVQTFSQVLVLVRSHDSAQKLVPYLRRAGIEHQLKDNGERYTSMVWSDTQALFAWLDNTHDNFSLLQLLRSPLFGMTPGQFNGLVRFAGESNCSVAWEALQQLATSHDWARQAVSTLQGWLKCAYSLPLFELVSLVEQSTQASERYLNASNASQRLLFAEHWHWLKGWALQVNNGRFSSLTKAIEEAQVLAEHKGSDGEGALGHSDVLRVFTVHSAKGLEADHVWLFDATKEVGPRGISTDLLFDWPLGEDYPTSVTVHDKDSRESPARADIMHIENRARLSEDDHLLYVAITRARHQVHVSGTLDHHGHAKGWYERLLAHSPAQVEWPEQTDAQALAGAAQWVKPAFPVPQAMAMPVGEPMDKLDGPELRMGTAMHKVLEYVDHFPADGFETFWADRLLDCEDELLVLSEAETRQVKQVVEHLLEMDSLSPWLRSASEAWNELEWVGEAGQLLRADRVVKTPDAWWVLDYKWTVNNENFTHYEAQVQQYMRLLKTTLAANDPELPIKGALIDRQGRVRPVSWV